MGERSKEAFRRDAERMRRVLELERRAEPRIRKRGPVSSCLLFVIALIAVGVIAFYALKHWSQLPHLFRRPAGPDTSEASPDNGY
ncbi:MAG: hypothetical protein ABIL25_05695 [candidate division WOR-3 bacterium]